MTATLPLDFRRSLAAAMARCTTPNATTARQFCRLIDLYRSLTSGAEGPDAALAEGLAAILLPAVKAAGARLRL